MLTPQIMIYIMTGICVIYCIFFQYFYGKKLCLEFEKIQNLSRSSSRSSSRVVPVTTGIIVENIPPNSIIVNIEVQ